MNKPIPETRTHYNLFECRDYLVAKYNIDFDSFWSYLCDCMDITNDSYITLPDWGDAKKEDQRVLDLFSKEFDQDVLYFVSW